MTGLDGSSELYRSREIDLASMAARTQILGTMSRRGPGGRAVATGATVRLSGIGESAQLHVHGAGEDGATSIVIGGGFEPWLRVSGVDAPELDDEDVNALFVFALLDPRAVVARWQEPDVVSVGKDELWTGSVSLEDFGLPGDYLEFLGAEAREHLVTIRMRDGRVVEMRQRDLRPREETEIIVEYDDLRPRHPASLGWWRRRVIRAIRSRRRP